MIPISRRGPECSVIVTTCSPAPQLERSLRSLGAQSIARDRYEIIVVDHGSAAEASKLCQARARLIPLRYLTAPAASAGRARNRGVVAARAPVVLLFDDCDAAHPDLVWQHLNGHRADGRERVAVRGRAAWSNELAMTGLMHHLAGPAGIAGKVLGPEPRMSYKTEFIRRHGVADESLGTLENLELHHRLDRHGLMVRSAQGAVSYQMVAPSMAEAGRAAEVGGRVLVRLAGDDLDLQEVYGLAQREARWRAVRWDLRRLHRKANRLEQGLDGDEPDPSVLARLSDIYARILEGLEGRGVGRERRRPSAPDTGEWPPAEEPELIQPDPIAAPITSSEAQDLPADTPLAGPTPNASVPSDMPELASTE